MTISYAEYVIAYHSPLALYLLDTLPVYGDPIVDEVGSRDARWSMPTSSDPPLPETHPAIFGNGDGSVLWQNRYALINHDLPEHTSWTASMLMVEVGGTFTNGWTATAWQRYFPPQSDPPPIFNTDATVFPAWSTGTVNVSAGDDPVGAVKGLYYRTSFSSIVEVPQSGSLAAGSEHWFAWRYQASARELSVWVDGVKVASKPVPYTPVHPTTQRLNMLNGMDSTAASHAIYWDRAVSDADLAAIADVAINGFTPADPVTVELQPAVAATAITGSVTMATRIDADGGAP